ncbi:MAG: DUF3343 domain-containing protein [Nitrospirae bacterium]|jgi:hypothetical protein|nr:DUF3343 domain-containing protein [Nitrospirota bacterium]
MNTYAIITFHNTHFALKAKKYFEKYGLKSDTIPVPREFSSECGFCSKILWKDKNIAEEIMKKNKIIYESIYRWERDEKKEKKFNFV